MSKIEITSKVSLTLPSRINPGMRGTIALSSRLKTKPTSHPIHSQPRKLSHSFLTASKTISQLPISQICIPKPHARPCQTNHSRIGIETVRHLKENKVHLNKSGTIEFAKNISNSYCSRIDIALIIVQWR